MSSTSNQTVTGWLFRVGGGIALFAIAIVVVWLFMKPGANDDIDDVLTQTIVRGDLVVSVTEQGTLQSSNDEEIRNKVRGFSVVTEVVDVGTKVKKDDVLVRLDTKDIENQLSTARTNVDTAKANLARSKANVKANKIAIPAYKQGRYLSQRNDLLRAMELAKKRLKIAEEVLKGTDSLYQMNFANRQELLAHQFSVKQYELEISVQKNSISALDTYTKEMQVKTLEGNLRASQTKLQSDEAALEEEETRLKRLEQELEDCVIRAPRDGLVIYPSAAAWKQTPDIDEGASVRMDQVLLLMPDLENMEVKVGIHESMIDQLKARTDDEAGTKAEIRWSEDADPILAEVSWVAEVTKPAGWWTGNVVKYDTIIKLPPGSGLKPGMTAKVKIVLNEHFNVLKIPVGAVVELDEKSYCWVRTPQGAEKRELELGPSNDVFIMVKSGVEEGEKVILNPLAQVDEAQSEAQKLIEKSRSYKN